MSSGRARERTLPKRLLKRAKAEKRQEEKGNAERKLENNNTE